MAQQILTTNDVATRLGVDPKALRKFFRSDKCKVIPVGQGKRYALSTTDVKEIVKQFHAWHTGKAVKAAEPTSAKAPRKTTRKPKPEPTIEIVEEITEESPTADALAEEELLSLDDATL